LTPHKIDQMTIPEIVILLEDTKGQTMSQQEVYEYHLKRHSMTPREKLEAARNAP